VSLTVEPGECFAYLGANGAGKTTTMKILVGLIRATSGQARLWGLPVSDPASRRRIGFVSEEPSLPPRLTAMEVLEHGGRLTGLSGRESRLRAAALLERLDIASSGGKQLARLSKGQRQRTALAHALVGNPDLLLLDEPLTGLDALGRREVIDLLGELRGEGKTIFFSSHILADVERLADRVAILRGGELAALGTPAEVAAAEGLTGARFEDVFLSLVAPERFAGGPRAARKAPGEGSDSRELVNA
jgi:ABC-2 type transport system ATP-binding protein